MNVRSLVRSTIALAVVVLLSTLAILDGDQPTSPAAPTVTVPLRDGRSIDVPRPDQAAIEDEADRAGTGAPTALENDLRQDRPASPAARRAADQATPLDQPPVPAAIPQASPSQPGCTTATLPRNWSSRNGAPVLLGVIHWTGSRPGSGRAIVSWFTQPNAQASSNYIVDNDAKGSCWYTVPETGKAWTQAAYNPWSVSIEIVNQGVQPLFTTTAARARVVQLMVAFNKRWGLPFRRAQVSGGRVLRSGFLAHRDLGSAGGGHPDVGSFDFDGLIRQAAAAAKGAPRKIVARDRARCKAIAAYRARRRADKPRTTAGTSHYRQRVQTNRRLGLRCVNGKVQRR